MKLHAYKVSVCFSRLPFVSVNVLLDNEVTVGPSSPYALAPGKGRCALFPTPQHPLDGHSINPGPRGPCPTAYSPKKA